MMIDEIIEAATSDTESISVLLRKCLVLAFQLKNDKLKEWVEKELDGYGRNEEVPPYRKVEAVSKGTFLGPFNSVINNQPLAPMILKKEHREILFPLRLRQPIAAYDTGKNETKEQAGGRVPWPPDMTAIYQRKFIDGYVLNRAWHELPASVIIALVDTIRNRILRFALEIKNELNGSESINPATLPTQKVDQYVTNYIINGGNNVIGSTASNITQQGSGTISQNDLDGLTAMLEIFGIKNEAIDGLQESIKQDVADGAPNSAGKRTSTWLKSVGEKVVPVGVSVSAEIIKATAKQYIEQHFGIILE